MYFFLKKKIQLMFFLPFHLSLFLVSSLSELIFSLYGLIDRNTVTFRDFPFGTKSTANTSSLKNAGLTPVESNLRSSVDGVSISEKETANTKSQESLATKNVQHGFWWDISSKNVRVTKYFHNQLDCKWIRYLKLMQTLILISLIEHMNEMNL